MGASTWKAECSMVFGISSQKTVLKSLKTQGPLYVQKLFYPEGENAQGVIPAHGYLLHPPGGLVSGDSLEADILIEEGAHALVTTPSAGKIYRARDELSRQRQSVKVTLSKDSTFEWLPMETIVFDGSKGEMDYSFKLHKDSRLIVWDIISLGRPESGESFVRGLFSQSMEIVRGGRLINLERLSLNDAAKEGLSALKSQLGFHNYPIYGMLVAAGFEGEEDSQALVRARDELRASHVVEAPSKMIGSVTVKRGVFLARALASDMESVKLYLMNVWSVVRTALLKIPAVPPRVWST